VGPVEEDNFSTHSSDIDRAVDIQATCRDDQQDARDPREIDNLLS
jgi:hypothetical protein